jgi:roadblock/LC7 domain-containing protein
MMDKLKKAFGYSDPLAQGQYQQTAVQYQQTMMNQAARQQASLLGAQNMAGGAPAGLGIGIANASNTGYNQQWGQALTPVGIREKVRTHIADEVEKMAEEIGAPTLLHAVVLAIRTMEIPE